MSWTVRLKNECSCWHVAPTRESKPGSVCLGGEFLLEKFLSAEAHFLSAGYFSWKASAALKTWCTTFFWMDRHFTELCSWHCTSRELLENTQCKQQDHWCGVLPFGMPRALPKKAPPVAYLCSVLLQESLQIPCPLCCISTGPAAGLSPLCQVLGMSVAGNPSGHTKEAWTVYKMAGGKVHLPGPELWCTVSLAPHLTRTNSDKPCHLLPDATIPKAGKARRAVNNSSFPKESPRDLRQGTALARPNAFMLGNLHSWLPGWNSPDEKTPARQARGKTWHRCFTPAVLLVPSLPARRIPRVKDLNPESDSSCSNSLHHPHLWLPAH